MAQETFKSPAKLAYIVCCSYHLADSSYFHKVLSISG